MIISIDIDEPNSFHLWESQKWRFRHLRSPEKPFDLKKVELEIQDLTSIFKVANQEIFLKDPRLKQGFPCRQIS